MERIRLTKHELKRHKENLRRYNRFLPTLTAKKQLLQRELVRIRGVLKVRREESARLRESSAGWIGLLAEGAGLEEIVSLQGIRTVPDNIAGVDIPRFEGADIAMADYDLVETPLWVDAAAALVKRLLEIDAESAVLKVQLKRLGEELRITTQRVNLFEKVKIPEAMEAIRRITIHLGDQQTAAVVWAKMAKRKLEEQAL